MKHLKWWERRVWKAKGDESCVRRIWMEWTLCLDIGGLFLLGPQGDRNTAFSVPLTCMIENCHHWESWHHWQFLVFQTLHLPWIQEDYESWLHPWYEVCRKRASTRVRLTMRGRKTERQFLGSHGETRYALLHQNAGIKSWGKHSHSSKT